MIKGTAKFQSESNSEAITITANVIQGNRNAHDSILLRCGYGTTGGCQIDNFSSSGSDPIARFQASKIQLYKDTEVHGNLKPSTDLGKNLGSSSKRFLESYIGNVKLSEHSGSGDGVISGANSADLRITSNTTFKAAVEFTDSANVIYNYGPTLKNESEPASPSGTHSVKLYNGGSGDLKTKRGNGDVRTLATTAYVDANSGGSSGATLIPYGSNLANANSLGAPNQVYFSFGPSGENVNHIKMGDPSIYSVGDYYQIHNHNHAYNKFFQYDSTQHFHDGKRTGTYSTSIVMASDKHILFLTFVEIDGSNQKWVWWEC